MPVIGSLWSEDFSPQPAGWETTTRYTGGPVTGYPNIYHAQAVKITAGAGPSGENVVEPDLTNGSDALRGGLWYRWEVGDDFIADHCRLTFLVKLSESLIAERYGELTGPLFLLGDQATSVMGIELFLNAAEGDSPDRPVITWGVFYNTSSPGSVSSGSVLSTATVFETDVWYRVSMQWRCGTITAPADMTHYPDIESDGCLSLYAQKADESEDVIPLIFRSGLSLLLNYQDGIGTELSAYNSIGDITVGYDPAEAGFGAVYILPGQIAAITLDQVDDDCPNPTTRIIGTAVFGTNTTVRSTLSVVLGLDGDVHDDYEPNTFVVHGKSIFDGPAAFSGPVTIDGEEPITDLSAALDALGT